MTDQEEKKYTKTVTPNYFVFPYEIIFEELELERFEKKVCLPIDDLEQLDVIDVNRFNKEQL